MFRNYQHPTFSIHGAKPTAYGQEVGYETTNILYNITSTSHKKQQLHRRSSNGWSRKWSFEGPAKVIWFKTYLAIFLYKKRVQEMILYCAGSTSLWTLMLEYGESNVTCREPYYFWSTFVLENVRDQNTLTKHRNERALSKSAAHVPHEYKCVLFIKACFTTSLGSEFNQVRRLSPFRSINLCLNRLPLHVTRHMAMSYSVSSQQLLHISCGEF